MRSKHFFVNQIIFNITRRKLAIVNYSPFPHVFEPFNERIGALIVPFKVIRWRRGVESAPQVGCLDSAYGVMATES